MGKNDGGTRYERPSKIAIDEMGNSYVIGDFIDTVDFDPGPGIVNLITMGDEQDVFIQKLDGNGDFQWVKSITGNGYKNGNDIVIDSLNNIFIVGSFEDTVDFDPGASKVELYANRRRDVFIEKLNSNGDFSWVRAIGGNGFDYSRAIEIDHLGNVYAAGVFEDTVDFDPGVGTVDIISEGDKDGFTLKLNTSDIQIGIHENNLNEEIVIYPNPTNGITLIKSDNKIQSITLFDLTGMKIMEVDNTNNIDLTLLKKGVYMCEIEVEGFITTKKIVKN